MPPHGKKERTDMKLLRAMREPLKYVQGKDALLKFKDEMGYMGSRWLFICSRSGYKACHDKIEQSFGDDSSYRRYEVFGGISSKGEIAKMKKIVEEDRIDAVVACGGGSAVDTAKATAYYTGKKAVIIPMVAATDAPCTGLPSSTTTAAASTSISSIPRTRTP
jgi:glycerol dehydrogenase